MTRIRRTSWVALSASVAMLLPAALLAQNASIAVSATVRARPLTLLSAARTTVPGELLVKFDGCGGGAIAVDTHTATATRRTSRVVLAATTNCTARTVALQLPSDAAGTVSWVVTLEQSDTLLSPAFAQFVVPATATAATRDAIAY
jgi:hypothetical protein